MRGLNGWVNGMIGVAIFSGSLVATRLGIDGFDPIFLTGARACLAGLLALLALRLVRLTQPFAEDLVPLLLVALGVVVGFPLLTALALQHVSAAHSTLYAGLLPLATALFGVLRGGERPHPAFWLFSVLGSALVVGFALTRGADFSLAGDLLMLGAVAVCGLGYAEGARLARRMGGLSVICWALVLSLPVMALVAFIVRPATLDGVPVSAWAGLAYVSAFSMFIGFIFWYRGLAQGGIATVGQLQLLQPFMGLALAALILGDHVGPEMLAIALGVLACVALARHFAARPVRHHDSFVAFPREGKKA